MIVISNFYCEECGMKGIPIPRKSGNQREQFHKKKLYCINCKKEVNHIECKNESEETTFKQGFNKRK